MEKTTVTMDIEEFEALKKERDTFKEIASKNEVILSETLIYEAFGYKQDPIIKARYIGKDNVINKLVLLLEKKIEEKVVEENINKTQDKLITKLFDILRKNKKLYKEAHYIEY